MKKPKKAKNKAQPPEPLVIEKRIEKIELPETGIKIINQDEFNQQTRATTLRDSKDSLLAKHKFRWNRNGTQRYLTGSFANNWTQWIVLDHKGELELLLPIGFHTYKYIIDGEWRCDPESEVRPDSSGNINNYLIIQSGRPDSPHQPHFAITKSQSDSSLSRSPSLHIVQDPSLLQRWSDGPRTENDRWLVEHIKSAFIHTGAQIVGLALLSVLYFMYIMLHPYLTSIFWALIISIVMRTPKNHVMNSIQGLSDIDLDNGSYWHVCYLKLCFIFNRIMHPVSHLFSTDDNVVNLLIGSTFGIFLYFSWSLALPWLLIVPCVTFLMTIVLLIVLNSNWYHTVIASVLVGILLVSLIFVFHFFIVLSVQDGHNAYTKLQVVIEERMSNEIMGKYFEKYNITTEGFLATVNVSSGLVNDWLLSNGMNVTNLYNFVNQINSEGLHINKFKQIANDTRLLEMGTWGGWYQWYKDLDMSPLALTSGVFLYMGFNVFSVLRFVWVTFQNVVLGFAVFLACVYYLLVSEEFFLDKLVEVLPVGDPRGVSNSLRKSVNGIFLSTIIICLTHGLTTYLLFIFLDFDFRFLATFFTAFTAIVPILSSWIVFIPLALFIGFRAEEHYIYQIIMLIASRFLLLWFSDPYIYSKIPNSHPYITGLSIVLGFSAFGVEGVLIGPLLIIFAVTIYDMFDQYKKL